MEASWDGGGCADIVEMRRLSSCTCFWSISNSDAWCITEEIGCGGRSASGGKTREGNTGVGVENRGGGACMSPLLTVEVCIRRGLLPHTSLIDFIELIRFKAVHSGLKGLDAVLPGKVDILLQDLLLGHACEVCSSWAIRCWYGNAAFGGDPRNAVCWVAMCWKDWEDCVVSSVEFGHMFVYQLRRCEVAGRRKKTREKDLCMWIQRYLSAMWIQRYLSACVSVRLNKGRHCHAFSRIRKF